MKPPETMKNVKALIHSLHTAIAVAIVTFATVSWGVKSNRSNRCASSRSLGY
jgi:hypothetical protein